MLPEIPIPNQSKETIQTFGGYNHNVRIGDHEFYEMENLSSDAYPTLSPRRKRGIVRNITDCKGLLGKGSIIAFVEGNKLVYGNHEMELDHTVTGERQLVSMGAYIIVFPDMMYFNTADPSDQGSIYGVPQTFEGCNGVQLCDVNGNDIELKDLHVDACVDGKDYFWGKSKYIEGDYILIDPTEQSKKYYLDGVVAYFSGNYKWNTLGTINGVDITYSYETEVMGWGKYGKKDIIRVGKDERGVYVATCWDEFEDYGLSLDGYCASLLEKKPEYAYILRIDITRTIGDESTTRYYFVYAKPKYVNHDAGTYIESYEIDTDMIRVGDLRMKRTDEGTEIQRCVSLFENSHETWKEKSCWVTIPTYVKITGDGSGIGDTLESAVQGSGSDTIKLSGKNEYYTVSLYEKYGEKTVMLAKDNAKRYSSDSILLAGCLDMNTTNTTDSFSINVTLKPTRREMDFLIESGNRLWGCRYGTNWEGKFVNEIYASALGSFREWNSFEGTSEDSYVASVGTDGAFTGAISFRGQPIFFKENNMHSVYGSYPSNYSVTTDSGTGVQRGSHKSLCVVQNVLYYKGIDGIYRYDGASYDKISHALGAELYSNAVACGAKNKLYVAMENAEKKQELFAYDIGRSMWHKENCNKISFLATNGNGIYFLDRDQLKCVGGGESEESEAVKWHAETGPIGYSTIDAKYLDKLQLRIELPVGSSVKFYVEYNSDGYFEYVGSITGKSKQAFTIPLFPRRCDHFRLRMEGEGDCKIFSMVKVMENGGEW